MYTCTPTSKSIPGQALFYPSRTKNSDRDSAADSKQTDGIGKIITGDG
jgi:hypothetical protein